MNLKEITILVTYLRSSSINTHEWCPHQYYLRYVLGLPDIPKMKAEKGTIVHKVMECLGWVKFCQVGNLKGWNDDNLGWVNIDDCDPMWLTEQCFYYYKQNTPELGWEFKDLKEVKKWVQKAIDFKDGYMDPRNRDIFSLEEKFDIEIEYPWAKFDYNLLDGTIISGNLAIKGTIDLVTKIDDKTIELIDYKTGKKLNWVTGKEKDFASFRIDPQLRFYHYALSKLYPQIETVLCTIYYINDGGPYTIPFHKEDIQITEDSIRAKFEAIKNTNKPSLNISWKCKSFCPFGAKGGNYINKNGVDTGMTKCEFFKKEIEHNGLSIVTNEYADIKNLSVYGAGGGRK